jgi:DNA-binding SARP family transcriptional activator
VKVEFRLLGDVAVLADGQPVDLGSSRQRSVFALLLLQRNRAITTEVLADRIWPDDQPLTAHKTIQVYISRIRRTLGPAADRLTSTENGYRLSALDDELDAARFERGLRKARETLASGSAERSIALLEEVLGLWSGPALGGLAAEPFARREAERLEELRIQALEELFELRIGSGVVREAIGDLRRLVGEQPGRERLWRLLMLALYGDGQQAEALKAYQDARRYLADELGLDPTPELQDLERAILTQEAPRASQPIPVPFSDVDATGDADRRGAANRAAGSGRRRTRRIVTVLRADVGVSRATVGVDPEILEDRERRALEVVRNAVERHGGTIDRADHEGVTAVFGLTIAREDDALRAVRAALELRGDAGPLEVADAVIVRLGIATGEVVAGTSDGHGSTISGQPLRTARVLAARADVHEVWLARETERLIRGVASTERMPPDVTRPDADQPASRLLALTDGDAGERRATTPFVGRGTETRALLAAFDRVVEQRTPGLATVIGAPGVGKSRLVAEAFARTSEHARILRSRCLPYGDGITYWPVRELLLEALAIEPGESRNDALIRLGSMVAGPDRADEVRTRLASVVGISEDPAPAEEIQWAVRRCLETLATVGPIVLLVDDLQWAEPALIDLFEHILDLGRGPILVVAIARPELEEVHPAWLARSNVAQVRLDSLDESDAAALLEHLAPELPSGFLRARIMGVAEGNPLFVEQFVAYVSDEASATARRLDDQTAVDLPIPPTIATLLGARLDRLPEGERRLLERASVVGRSFGVDAVRALLPADDQKELPRRLGRLVRRDLIRPDRSGLPGDEAFRFRHLLIRDAAYAALPKIERAELHERFADWLERRTAANPGEYDLILGYHLEQAYRYRVELGGNPAFAQHVADRAFRHIVPAGRAAEERGDPHAAASLLRRAVDLAPAGPERIDVLLDLMSALRTAGERDASEATEAEAIALLAEYPDEGLERRRRLANVGFSLVMSGAALREAQDGYAFYERAGDRLGMIRALHVASGIHRMRGEFTVGMKELDHAVALAIEIGRPDRAAQFASLAANAIVDSPVPVPGAIDRCVRYLDLVGDHRGYRALTLLAIGQLEAFSGGGNGWRRHFDSAKAIIDDLGLLMPLGAALHPISVGVAELAAGEPARAIDLLRWSCLTLDRLGTGDGKWPDFLATVAPLTAQTLLALGQLEEVERYAFWGRDVAEAEDLDAQARWRFAISGLRTQQGRHDEAVALARDAVSLLAKRQFAASLAIAHRTLAIALRAAGEESQALAAAREAQHIAAARQDVAELRTLEAFLRV